MSKYIVAIDVGTTGTKAMVLSDKGDVLGAGYGEYGCLYPHPNWVEQDAEHLTEMTFKACKTAIEKANVPADSIACVAFSTQRATFGFVDDKGNMLNNRLYGWQDNRAASVIGEITSKIDAGELYAISGMPVTPTFSVEKVYWVMKNDPETYNKAKYIVMMPDYIMYRFGADDFFTEVTNACCSGMVDVYKLEWSDRILDALGIDKRKLPKLVNPSVKVGEVKEDIAKLTGLPVGTPIVTGTGDQQCAALGAGVIEDGFASLTLGTAGLLVVGSKTLDLRKSPGLMAPSSGALGLFELEGIQLGAASSYRWIRDVLAEVEVEEGSKTGVDPYVLMEKHVEASKPGSNGVVFLPYLTGAGYPTWNPETKGVFAGLKFSNTKSDLIRAVMEGITLEAKDMYEAMKTSDVTIRSLTITGGATKSPAWRQIIADMFDAEIKVLKVPDATIIGAAILGAIGVGIYENPSDAVANMVEVAYTLKPIKENVEKYNEVYQVYRALYQSLINDGVFNKLSSL
jgi:xylulokinase